MIKTDQSDGIDLMSRHRSFGITTSYSLIEVWQMVKNHGDMLLGGVFPYLGMVGRFRSDHPHFLDLLSDRLPILWLITI